MCKSISYLVLLNVIAFPIPAPADTPAPVRIVALGDSITRGVRTGVKDDETYEAQLQATLAKEKLAVEVVNVPIVLEQLQKRP